MSLMDVSLAINALLWGGLIWKKHEVASSFKFSFRYLASVIGTLLCGFRGKRELSSENGNDQYVKNPTVIHSV